VTLSDKLNDPGPLPERLGRIAKLLEDSGIPLDEVGRIDKVRIGDYQTTVKIRNEDGSDRLEQVTNRADSLVITPSWETGPEWPVIQPAAPTVVKATTAKRPDTDGWRQAVILPDPQIGYRRYEDGTLDPFHDEQAMAVALKLVRALRPDVVVNLGDFLDFAQFGTFEQEPAFALTTQAALDRGHRFLAEQRANAPEADIVLLEGNHDRRLLKATIKNAAAAFGLRRANVPESWPVLSVPHLLRLDELDVEYIEGYPAGIYWVNENVACIHGHKVRSAGSTAAAVIDDERVSTIFGHVHRIELQHKTRRTKDGPRFSFAATPGCLCRLDGAVPSTKSSTDSAGRPVGSVENWQQGVAVVTFEPGNGRFAYEVAAIYDGELTFRGQRFEA
jgi:predicted phosphodiesterase